MKKLDKSGIPHQLVNIWETDGATEVVRSHAGGNETVPTVRVGRRWFVNPSIKDLKKAYEDLGKT